MTNLVKIQKLANELKNSDVLVGKELRKVQSIKCRLKKQKGLKSYESKMTEVLKKEQLLKEVRSFIVPEKMTVTKMTQKDVDVLDYDETTKAIKSIQSKKTNSQYLTTVQFDNDEYRNAIEIEKMLLEHKKNIKPIDETTIRKTEIMTLINEIENLKTISKTKVLEYLNNLI